jgi:putative phage-type endonuclease
MLRVQGTPEWKLRRRGKITASRIFDIVNVSKRDGRPLAAYHTYLEELAQERATGIITERGSSGPMRDGVRKEPTARFLYALENDVDIEEVEFIDHPEIANAGCSPDGIIRHRRKIIEIKCPTTKTFLEYVENKKVKPEYICQIGWQFACMPEIETCDYVVYCDEMPPGQRLITKTILRDRAMIHEFEKRVIAFDALVEARAAQIRGD